MGIEKFEMNAPLEEKVDLQKSEDFASNEDMLMDIFGDEDLAGSSTGEAIVADESAAKETSASVESVAAEEEASAGDGDELEMPEDLFENDDKVVDAAAAEEASKIIEVPEDDSDLDEEEQELTENFNEKQRHAFGKVKHDRKELRQMVRDQNAELKKLSAQVQEPEIAAQQEIERLKIEVANQEKHISQLDLSSSKEFKVKYNGPITERVQRIAKMFAREGLEQARANQLATGLARMSHAERAKRVYENAPLYNGAIINLYEEFDNLQAKRAEALRDASSMMAANAESRKRKDDASRAASIDESVAYAVSAMSAQKNLFFKSSKADTEKAIKWNKAVADRIGIVKGVLVKNDSHEIAEYIADGVSSRHLRSENETMRKEVVRLRKENETLKGVPGGPTVSSSSGSSATLPASISTEGKSNEQMLNEIFYDKK